MCKMYWHPPFEPTSLSLSLSLSLCSLLGLSVCLSAMWGGCNSKLLPVQFIKQIDIACYYTRQMPTPPLNRKMVNASPSYPSSPSPPLPPLYLPHLAEQIKLNIYSHLRAILFRFIEAICQRHVLLWLASRRWGNLCHSMSTPRRGHRDPVTVTVLLSVQDPLRASSSNSSNRAQPQHVNWQARSNYMQQATSRLRRPLPALSSSLAHGPLSILLFSLPLHALLSPLATSCRIRGHAVIK